MRGPSSYDRTRSMRINRALRNISLSLAFISFAFMTTTGLMIFMNIAKVQWWEFAISAFAFLVFLNLGLHFHVSFKRKD
ncbi:MAG: hypothetical protein OEM52_09555 [bacterium]|nr:hypothetical protein [bacterium]